MDRRAIIFERRVFLFALCLIMSACKPDVRAVSLHIGDSLMAQATTAIQSEQTTQDSAVLTIFNAVAGSGLYNNNYWVPRLGYIQERVNLDVVFISLGSNDIHLSHEEFQGEAMVASQVDELMASFPAATIVYWIMPHSNVGKLWSTGAQYETVTRTIIDAAVSGDWPNLRILDFDSWVASQGMDLSSALENDEIHLSEAGRRTWADMIQSAIDMEFPPN